MELSVNVNAMCQLEQSSSWKISLSLSLPSFLLLSPVLAGGEGEFTWHKDGKNIIDKEKVSEVDDSASKLFIKKATLQDAGMYTCQCNLDSGHDSIAKQLYVYGT